MTRQVTRILLSAALAALLVGCDLTGGRTGLNSGSGDDDAAFTIHLEAFLGPNHNRVAKDRKTRTEELLGWKGMLLVHQNARSVLYWGRYASIQDAEGDLKRAKTARSKLGHPIYPNAVVVPLEGKNYGPPEWHVSSAPADRYYTVLVAIFFDVPEATQDGNKWKRFVGRKKFAVEACRQLRSAGYDAYYHHGPVQSHVMVGSFARRAYGTKIGPDGVVKAVFRDPRLRKILRDRRFEYLAVNNLRSRVLVPDVNRSLAFNAYERSRPIPIPGRESQDDRSARNRHGYGQPGQGPGDPTGAGGDPGANDLLRRLGGG